MDGIAEVASDIILFTPSYALSATYTLSVIPVVVFECYGMLHKSSTSYEANRTHRLIKMVFSDNIHDYK